MDRRVEVVLLTSEDLALDLDALAVRGKQEVSMVLRSVERKQTGECFNASRKIE